MQFFQADFLFLISLWLSTLIMGWTSWPITALCFGKLSDQGYSFSKFIGFLVPSYFLFVLVTLRVVSLSLFSIFLMYAVWAALNALVQYKFRPIEKKRVSLKQIISIELCFFALMAFWAWIRSHNPEVYSIERFMDFGLIQSLFSARSLPLFDMWFLGEKVNYYYFGHVIAYVILSITRIPIIPGFFLIVAWIFGISAITIYRIAKDIAMRHVLISPLKAVLAGTLSVFAVLFAGTWHTIPWLFHRAHAFWYPESTRIIPGTITEFPLYTFLVADLHAHMWGLLNGVLVIGALFCISILPKNTFPLKTPVFFSLAFFLGISAITNTWDALTLGIVSCAILFTSSENAAKWKYLLLIFLLTLFSYMIALPWSLFYVSPISHIGIVQKHSPLLPWLSVWGSILATIFLFMLRCLWLFLRKNKKNEGGSERNFWFLCMLIAIFFCFLIGIEFFYIQDILKDGIWFRANTVFKIAIQLWLWMGIIAGPIIVWTVFSCKKYIARVVFGILFCIIFAGPALYPIKAITQAQIKNNKAKPLESGISWLQNKFPSDYEALMYLSKIRDSLPQNDRIRNIVEAEGDSYTDVSRFSALLGWPTIIGWPVHEWTWRGTYNSIAARRNEVREIYAGVSLETSKNILKKYAINYIIVGQVERLQYQDQIKTPKLKQLGNIVFENKDSMIIQTSF